MATKDKEKDKKKAQKAPTSTYTPINSSLNSTYKAPTTTRKSNIVVSQADLTPVQTTTQARQPIQVNGALASLQPKKTPNVDVTNPMSMTQTIYGVRDDLSRSNPQQAPDVMKNNDRGLLMNKLTPNAPLYAPPVPEEKLSVLDKASSFLSGLHSGATLGVRDWVEDKIADVTGLPRNDRPENTYSKVGDFIGSAVIPGETAGKFAAKVAAPITNKLGQIVARGALGGATYGTMREAAEAATGQNDQTLGQRAKDVAIDTGLGVGADLGLSALGKGVSSIISKLRSKGIPEETITRITQLPENEIVRISELSPDEINVVLRDANIPETPVIKRNRPEFQPETYLPEERIAERSGTTATPTPDVFPVSAKIKAKGALSEPTIQPPIVEQNANVRQKTVKTQPEQVNYEPKSDFARWVQNHIAGYGVYGGRAFTDAGDKVYSQLFYDLSNKLKNMDVLNPKPGENEIIAEAYDKLKNYVASKGGQADFEATASFKGVEERIGRKQSQQAQPYQPQSIPTQQPVQAEQVAQQFPTHEAPKPGERALYSNIESTEITPELRSKMAGSQGRQYNPITNEETLAAANKRISRNLESAISYARAGKNVDAEKVATGFRALQELQSAGRFDEAAELVDDMAAKLTKAGQTVQAASLIQRLSPEGQLLRVQRRVNELNRKLPADKQVKLDAETTQKITETAQAAQAARLSQERAAEVLQISEKLRAGEELTVAERQTLTDFVEDLKTYTDNAKPDLSPSPQPDTRPAKRRKRDEIIKWLDAKEKAAQERLNRKRGNFNSNPFDTWVDMGIVAASKMAKGSVKFSDFSKQMIQEFGEQVEPYLKRAFTQGKKIMKRTTNRINSADASEAQKIAEKYLRDNGSTMSTADVDKIRDLASSLNTLQSGTKEQAEMELQKIINKYEKASMWDKVQALRYISMLLNTGTQAVNALSGPLMATTGTLADLLPVMADKVISASLKKPRNITLYGTNPARFIGQYLKNLKTGAKAGWQGINPAGLTDQRDIGGLVYKGKLNPLSWLERSLGTVAKGADYATYKTVYDAEIKRSGWLDAKNKGIKGRDEVKRHVENYAANPTPEAMDQADKIARNTTFQSNNRAGAKAANSINSMHPLIKVPAQTIMPFVKTPVNIAETALEMTPLGLIRGLYQLSSKSEATQREALRTLGMSVVGTGGLSALGYELSRAGILTGANDSGDKDVDKIRQQAGKGAYLFNSSAMSRYAKALLNGEGFEAAERAAKFQEGDKQFNYNKLQPLAFPAAIGASLQENSDKSVGQQLKSAGMDAYGSLYGMSSLKGLQDTFSSDYSGTTGEKAIAPVQRIVESFAKSFSPSILAQEARRQDSTQRKTSFNNGFKQDVQEYFMSRTPGLSQKLPANKTTLGQDKQNAPGIAGQYANPYQSNTAQYNDAAAFISDLIDRTGDTSLAPSAPDKKVRGRDRVTGQQVVKTIPAERYAQLQQDVGDEIIQRIMAIPQEWNDNRKAEAVTKIYTSVNEKYRNKLKKELGIRVSR